MEEALRFVTLAQTVRFPITELCAQFGISRKTACEHRERYAVGDFKRLFPAGLAAVGLPRSLPVSMSSPAPAAKPVAPAHATATEADLSPASLPERNLEPVTRFWRR